MVSIVTVSYNEVTTISRTLRSVINQRGVNTELIVIDGGSTDGTVDKVRELADHIRHFESGPDLGIYHAMNKGWRVACGEWVNFMNAGDVFVHPNALRDLLSSVPDDVAIVYGKAQRNDRPERPFPLDVIRSGVMPFCHQAAVFSRSRLKGDKPLYDQSFRIYGDYDLVAKVYAQDPRLFHYSDALVCRRGPGGVSSVVSTRKRVEKYRAVCDHFGVRGVWRAIVHRLRNPPPACRTA